MDGVSFQPNSRRVQTGISHATTILGGNKPQPYRGRIRQTYKHVQTAVGRNLSNFRRKSQGNASSRAAPTYKRLAAGFSQATSKIGGKGLKSTRNRFASTIHWFQGGINQTLSKVQVKRMRKQKWSKPGKVAGFVAQEIPQESPDVS